MDELCRTLRAARERAGLTLEEISARTKIGLSTLRALESGDFDRLPGEFYTRTFLRTYARELSLPPEDVLRDYDIMRSPVPPVTAAPPRDETPAAEPLYSAPTEGRPGVRNSNAWAAGVFGVLMVAALALAWRQATPTGSEEAPAAAVAAHHETEPVPTPTGTAGRGDIALAADARSRPLTIEISPTADVWVTARTDGKKTLFKLLKPGDRVTVNADREIAFRVGNAGAFAYTINGAPGKPVGTAGEVREFKITPETAATFKSQ